MKLLFVCLGNICRSPTAEGIARYWLEQHGLTDQLVCDSAGTGDWHLGLPPDERAVRAAAQRGYDLSVLRARQLTEEDFYRFDHIVVMDRSNLDNARRLQPDNGKATLSLLLDVLPEQPLREVPDPYYGGVDGFEQVLDLLEKAVGRLLNRLIAA